MPEIGWPFYGIKKQKMATRESFKLSTEQKRYRTFSDNFKKSKVQEIEQGFVRVNEICKLYDVTSSTALEYHFYFLSWPIQFFG